MANYSHLKVYKDIYDLSLILMKSIRKFPKTFKYTLGEKMQNIILNSIGDLISANSSFEKREKISQMIYNFELLQVQIKLAKDLECFSNLNNYFIFSEKNTEILKQLEGWKKSSKN